MRNEGAGDMVEGRDAEIAEIETAEMRSRAGRASAVERGS
jgi:hypothetical protein